jgi:hypothetical protein
VTISGASGGGAAEVLVSGGDEERPPRSRWRAAAAVATVALLLGGVALSRGDSEPPPPVSQATDLALVETGGALNLRWGYGGRLDVQLPLLLRNLDEEMTISSVALDGTSLVQPAVEVALVPDGRLPVTLRQALTCPTGAAVPADAALRVDVRRQDRAETRWLELPDGVLDTLAESLARQCSAFPLEQAVVLDAAEVSTGGDVVNLSVQARNISPDEVLLVQVDAATGFRVTVVPDATASTAGLPAVPAGERVVLRLEVAVADCAAFPPADKLDTAGVADVTYDDGLGDRATKAVAGDLPMLRALLERRC